MNNNVHYQCYWCSNCGRYQSGEVKNGRFICDICGYNTGHY